MMEYKTAALAVKSTMRQKNERKMVMTEKNTMSATWMMMMMTLMSMIEIDHVVLQMLQHAQFHLHLHSHPHHVLLLVEVNEMPNYDCDSNDWNYCCRNDESMNWSRNDVPRHQHVVDCCCCYYH